MYRDVSLGLGQRRSCAPLWVTGRKKRARHLLGSRVDLAFEWRDSAFEFASETAQVGLYVLNFGF